MRNNQMTTAKMQRMQNNARITVTNHYKGCGIGDCSKFEFCSNLILNCILNIFKRFALIIKISIINLLMLQMFSNPGLATEPVNSVKNNSLPFTPPTKFPLNILGRCHMSLCSYYQITDLEKTTIWSPSVTGLRIKIYARRAKLVFPPDVDYPQDPLDRIMDATWEEEPFTFEIFCSLERPAWNPSYDETESWYSLDPTTVFGFSETTLNIYYGICHGPYNKKIFSEIRNLAFANYYSMEKNFYSYDLIYESFDDLIKE